MAMTTPTWQEALLKHETLHTGNCYCDEDDRCNSKDRLIAFITRVEAEAFQRGKDAAVEYLKKKVVAQQYDHWAKQLIWGFKEETLEEARNLPRP